MKVRLFFSTLMVLLFCIRIATAQDPAAEYRTTSLWQQLAAQERLDKGLGSREDIQLDAASLVASLVEADGTNQQVRTRTILIGDWGKGLITARDTRGRGQATSIGFFYVPAERQPLRTTRIAVLKNRVYVGDIDGKLLILTNRGELAGEQDGDFLPFEGVAPADALLPMPEIGQVWLGNAYFTHIIPYLLEPFKVFGRIIPDGKLGNPTTLTLPSRGVGTIALARSQSGDVAYALSVVGSLFRVPVSFELGVPLWGREEFIAQFPFAIALSIGPNGNVYVLAGRSGPIGPATPPPSVRKIEGGGPPEPLPMRIYEVSGSGGKSINTLYADFSFNVGAELNGFLAAGDGVFYFINHTEDGSEVIELRQRELRATRFLSARMLGNTTLSGLAFLTEEQAPAPSVDLKVNGSDNVVGITGTQTINMSWSSNNADSCTAISSPQHPGWSGPRRTSGQQTLDRFTPGAGYSLALECSGPGGSAIDKVLVLVAPPLPPPPPPPPFVDLKINGRDGPVGIVANQQPVTLSWMTIAADSCVASTEPQNPVWAGPKPLSGQQSIGGFAAGTGRTFVMTCTGPGGVARDEVDLIITLPPPSGGGGGGGS